MTRKTVFITGASSGIGLACAKKFSAQGYRVFIGYNTKKDVAEKLAKELGDALAIQIDVRSEESIKQAFTTLYSHTTYLDVVVNNAGIYAGGDVSATSESFMKNFSVNALGLFLCSQQYILHQETGSIVNVTSIRALDKGAKYNSLPYSASKAAAHSISVHLAKGLKGRFRVNAVAPGFTRTEMNMAITPTQVKEMAPGMFTDDMLPPSEIANAVYFLGSDQSSMITGQTIIVDAGDTT